MSDLIFNELAANNGCIGEIILNRPQALNALNFNMVMLLLDKLNNWQQNDDIKAVIVRSNSSKAFCAGGDVVSLYEQGLESSDKPMPFFRHEYQLNCLIRSYAKPYICLLDGITMGGGVGISLHGKYSLATENFSFAMPETGIGFFPDVGGGYLLTRCKKNFGTYLALTGKRISRADAIYANLIKYSIKNERQNEFVDGLLKLDLSSDIDEKVMALIHGFEDPDIGLASLIEYEESISNVFSLDSIESMLEQLQVIGGAWSDKTMSILASKSPTALKVTLAQMQHCQGLTMEDSMALEYRIVSRFMQGKDFFEGIRALLIDKDKQPRWQPNILSDISINDVEQYFAPLASELWS